MVAVTGSSQYSGFSVLFEKVDSGLPRGLMASPALLTVCQSTVYIPVVNVGAIDVILYWCTRLCWVSNASIASLPKGVVIRTIMAMSANPLPVPVAIMNQIKDVALSPLTILEQEQVWSLLLKYSSVFSAQGQFRVYHLDGLRMCVDMLSDACWFSTMDLPSRHNQVPGQNKVNREKVQAVLRH